MNSQGNTSANGKENPEKLEAWQTDETLKYKDASSDEGALVAAAAKRRFNLQAKENNIHHVRMAANALALFFAGMDIQKQRVVAQIAHRRNSNPDITNGIITKEITPNPSHNSSSASSSSISQDTFTPAEATSPSFSSSSSSFHPHKHLSVCCNCLIRSCPLL